MCCGENVLKMTRNSRKSSGTKLFSFVLSLSCLLFPPSTNMSSGGFSIWDYQQKKINMKINKDWNCADKFVWICCQVKTLKISQTLKLVLKYYKVFIKMKSFSKNFLDVIGLSLWIKNVCFKWTIYGNFMKMIQV